MATSSKRFIIIAILTDILLMMMLVFVANSGANPVTEMELQTNGIVNYGDNVTDIYGESSIDESTSVLDKSFGNPIGFMRQIFNMITNGNELPDEINCPDCPDATTGGLFGLFIALYFGIVHILAIFELFQIFYSKKTD